MDEHQNESPSRPVLRPHRLIPTRPGTVPAEGLPVAAIGQQVESWLEASSEVPTPALALGGSVLAQQAWLYMEKAALTLDALPAVFKAAGAPEAPLQALELIGSILLAFPDLMASGLETNVARVDWMFSRLTNAPGHPGLVETLIEALEELPANDEPDAPPADYSAEIEILRGLHRNLVTLQQRWDDLIETSFPVVFPPPLPPLPAGESKAGPAGVSIGKRHGPPAFGNPAPLPTGWFTAHTTAGGATARAFRSHMVSKQQQRLVMLLALGLLVVTVLGIMLALARSAPSASSGSASLLVAAGTPTQATAHQSAPVTASPTPTQPAPTPTPRPPTPTPHPPTPTPGSSAICPPGAVFCVSVAQLQVPCAGSGAVTFQLISNTGHNENWLAISLLGGSLVTISPASGALKHDQTVTLSVQANTNQNHDGTIRIYGPFGTSPINVAVEVCD